MCSRHRELNGADSAEAWNPRPFRVLVCDRFDEDDRFTVKVRAAIGPHDAFNQVREFNPDVSPLTAEEVTPEEAARWAAEDRADADAKAYARAERVAS